MASTIGPSSDVLYRAKIDTSGAATLQVTRPFEVADVVLRCSAAHAGGTMTVQRSTDGTTYNDVTNAMTCAVDATVARAASIATTQAAFAKGDYIKVVPASSAEGYVYIHISLLAVQ